MGNGIKKQLVAGENRGSALCVIEEREERKKIYLIATVAQRWIWRDNHDAVRAIAENEV